MGPGDDRGRGVGRPTARRLPARGGAEDVLPWRADATQRQRLPMHHAVHPDGAAGRDAPRLEGAQLESAGLGQPPTQEDRTARAP
eukprot:3081923-Pyramimonas_sp.AAC.1